MDYSFSETLDECYVCFDELIDDQIIDLGCEHRMCKTCARNYFVEHVSELKTERCKCPEPTCDKTADGELIKYFVDIYNNHGKTTVGVAKKQEKSESPQQESQPKKDKTNSVEVTNNCNNSCNANNSQESGDNWSEFEPKIKKPKIEPDSPELIIDKEVRKCPQCKSEIEVSYNRLLAIMVIFVFSI